MTNSAGSTRKRQRTDSFQSDSSSQSSKSERDYGKTRRAIDALNPYVIKNMLSRLAAKHNVVLEAIDSEYQQVLRQRQSSTVNFDRHSKELWQELNVTYKHLSESQRIEEGFGIGLRLEDVSRYCDLCVRRIS